MRKLWQPRPVPAQQPRRGDAKLPFWEPHMCRAHPRRDCPRSGHCRAIWTLFFFFFWSTVPQIWFWFEFSCQPDPLRVQFSFKGEKPSGSVYIWFDSLQQFQFYVDRKSQRGRAGYFPPRLCQAHNPSCLGCFCRKQPQSCLKLFDTGLDHAEVRFKHGLKCIWVKTLTKKDIWVKTPTKKILWEDYTLQVLSVLGVYVLTKVKLMENKPSGPLKMEQNKENTQKQEQEKFGQEPQS